MKFRPFGQVPLPNPEGNKYPNSMEQLYKAAEARSDKKRKKKMKKDICIRGTEINFSCDFKEEFDLLENQLIIDEKVYNKSYYDENSNLAWYRLAPKKD